MSGNFDKKDTRFWKNASILIISWKFGNLEYFDRK